VCTSVQPGVTPVMRVMMCRTDCQCLCTFFCAASMINLDEW
jgi:hypothetical protein